MVLLTDNLAAVRRDEFADFLVHVKAGAILPHRSG
jgi:hypothetical protein